jgi:hypothetical protein
MKSLAASISMEPKLEFFLKGSSRHKATHKEER